MARTLDVLQITNLGIGNEICIADDVMQQGTGAITITGNDNHLSISAGSTLIGATIRLGSRCTVLIDSCRLGASEIFSAADSTISIGKSSAFTWKTQILAHEKSDIHIGEDCLFATDSLVTVSDMHSIVDLDSGLRLNSARDVCIADHVWIGLGALVMKGVSIGTGAIVGAGSIVTKDIPPNSLAAGSPARVIRQRVTWKFDLI